MNKTAIKNFAVWARNKLIADITYRAGLVGVSDKSIAQPLPQSSKDLQFFDIGTKDYAQIAGKEVDQRKALVKAIQDKEYDSDYATAFKAVIEEVAYTWFNRLIAIRFMEVNDYLPSRVRVLSSENQAKNEPDFVTTPFDTDMEFTTAEQDRIMQLKDENKLDALFRMLFIKQCNKLHEILPELFENTNDYTELLLSISFTDSDGIVYHLVHDIDEDDFNIEKEGQVEIIGWLYQYYNSEPKDEAFALLKKNVKITKERIPAATQLFTPDWIVRYMVENSLGRLWMEGHPNEGLKKTWNYYLNEAPQEIGVESELSKNYALYRSISPENIKIIDPCMGSGHILVYCFDVLMQIYESLGYIQRDAVQAILEHNIFGLDIDKRAAQLSYFALMMKARQYDRRIFWRNLKPNVYVIEESNDINRSQLKYFGAGFCEDEKKRALYELNELLDTLIDAKEYGSILNIENCNWNLLQQFVCNTDTCGQMTLDTIGLEDTQDKLMKLVKYSQILSSKYEIVVTNPPYMSNRGMGKKLANYILKNYKDAKNDMFSVFVEVAANLTNSKGIYSMITQPSIISLSAFKYVRERIIRNQNIISLIHMGRGIFGVDFGSTAFVIRKDFVKDYNSTFMKLHKRTFQYIAPEDIQKIYLMAKDDENYTFDFEAYKSEEVIDAGEEVESNILGTEKIHYVLKQEEFLNIPDNPFAYWMPKVLIREFTEEKISDYSTVTNGLFTCDNNRFLRMWYEVSNLNTNYNCKSKEQNMDDNRRWYPYNKGGNYRKWFGNHEYVVDFKYFGKDISDYRVKSGQSASFPGQDFYFKQSLSWSFISAEKFGIRYYPEGFVFDIAGSSVFPIKEAAIYNVLAFLGSEVAVFALQILNPTMNYQAGNVRQLPLREDVLNNSELGQLAKENVYISMQEWNSYELSWNFTKHPLTKSTGMLKNIFKSWSENCDVWFNKLKKNEERINQIVISIYELSNEISPYVEDKYVTIRKADLQRDIKNLLSYAVGCMFGRYSLDTDGLAYAGGEWDDSKYSTFIPDKDNCIPITDEPYFEDDVVGLFCAWLKKVYGEDTLEENLDFIAKALGNKGSTSREVIRNYFLNDFIKDHIKTYQKRPIYWLFDSGKQNGFKALVYMHRWDADTVGNLRVEYLHKTQRIYEREIQRMQETMDNSHDSREINKASKRKEKLQKQLKETKDYDTMLAHIALSRIDIDLDDGVKVNYEKVQTGRDGKKMQILAKI